jgi:hypothetical protein
MMTNSPARSRRARAPILRDGRSRKPFSVEVAMTLRVDDGPSQVKRL